MNITPEWISCAALVIIALCVVATAWRPSPLLTIAREFLPALLAGLMPPRLDTSPGPGQHSPLNQAFINGMSHVVNNEVQRRAAVVSSIYREKGQDLDPEVVAAALRDGGHFPDE